jgi:hypothetical protein
MYHPYRTIQTEKNTKKQSNSRVSVYPLTLHHTSVKPSAPVFNPLSIAGCVLWIDANDATTITQSGGFVASVNDKSTAANNLTSGQGFTYPNNTFNGTFPSFFCNTTTHLNAVGRTANPIAINPITIFYVGQQSAGGSGYAMDGLAADRVVFNRTSNTFEFFAGVGFTTASGGIIYNPFILSWILPLSNSTQSTAWCNSTQILNNTLAGQNNLDDGFSLGSQNVPSGGNAAWGGHICEVLIYNSALSTTNRGLVETYLSTKWGIAL